MNKHDNQRAAKLYAHRRSLIKHGDQIYPIKVNFIYQQYAYQRSYGLEVYLDMRNFSDLILLSKDILGIAWVIANSETNGFYSSAILYFNAEQYAKQHDVFCAITRCWQTVTDGHGVSRLGQLTDDYLLELASLAWRENNTDKTLYTSCIAEIDVVSALR